MSKLDQKHYMYQAARAKRSSPAYMTFYFGHLIFGHFLFHDFGQFSDNNFGHFAGT